MLLQFQQMVPEDQVVEEVEDYDFILNHENKKKIAKNILINVKYNENKINYIILFYIIYLCIPLIVYLQKYKNLFSVFLF